MDEERENDKAEEHKGPQKAAREGAMSQDTETSGQLYQRHEQSPGIMAVIHTYRNLKT